MEFFNNFKSSKIRNKLSSRKEILSPLATNAERHVDGY